MLTPALRPLGFRLGLVDEKEMEVFYKNQDLIKEGVKTLQATRKEIEKKSMLLSTYLSKARKEISRCL